MKYQSGTSLDRETIIEIDAKQPSATRVPQTEISSLPRTRAGFPSTRSQAAFRKRASSRRPEASR
jgi:hypothetical protein